MGSQGERPGHITKGSECQGIWTEARGNIEEFKSRGRHFVFYYRVFSKVQCRKKSKVHVKERKSKTLKLALCKYVHLKLYF